MLRPPSPRVQFSLLATLVSFACGIGLAGCDRTGELAKSKSEGTGHFVAADREATDLLERCAAAYARLSSYSDAGRVVLTYKVDGETAQDTAPLSVAIERPNRLGLHAYQVTAGVTENRFRMRLTSDQDSPVRSQVVSRALPERIDNTWLMLDSVAAQHLSAGLAGAPPQLDLLLSEQPFRNLLDESATVSQDGQGSEAGKSFEILKIVRGEAKFRLWIDTKTSLLRRIELPTATLPAGMLADKRISDIRLSIEFDDVIANSKVNWSDWQVPIVALDQMVRYFVAPPEIALDQRLGKAIPAFRLNTVDELSIDSSKRARAGDIQLFVWLADHPSCRTTAEHINQSLKQLPQEVRDQVEAVAVWAEPSPPTGMTFGDLAQAWQVSMPIVVDKDALGRDLLGVVEAPTIVILDRQHRLQFFQERAHPLLPQALPELLTRLVSGESLADTMNEKAREEHERFVAQLWLARASDGAVGAFTRPNPYVPQLMSLKEQSRKVVEQSIVAMTADALHNVWILKADGKVERLDSVGRTQETYTTDWITKEAALVSGSSELARMAVDDKAKFVAVSTSASRGLRVLDTTTRKTSSIALGSGQAITDFRWLASAQGSRLAAITDAGRTVLIDPTRDQQLSGQSPSRPLALLDRTTKDTAASGYVILADGRIEPVVLKETNGAKPAVTAKPVSTNSSAAFNPVIERQLQFTPGNGPWSVWQGKESSATLARGLLAHDEPAVFLLDHELRQLWHAPLPLNDASDSFLASVAHDPVSGQPLWVAVQPQQTLHFFRADGKLVDHCQLDEAVRGVALIPNGNELHLWLAHRQSLVHYKLHEAPTPNASQR